MPQAYIAGPHPGTHATDIGPFALDKSGQGAYAFSVDLPGKTCVIWGNYPQSLLDSLPAGYSLLDPKNFAPEPKIRALLGLS